MKYKYFFSTIFVRVLSYVYTIRCRWRFCKVVDLNARWIGLGRSRRTVLSQISKQNPSHTRAELFVCTSISHEKPLCICVLQFWDVYQTSRTLDKLARSSYTGSCEMSISQVVNFQPRWIASLFNSSCLEIDYFGKKTTGNVKFG